MSTNSSLILSTIGELLDNCDAPGVHLLLEYDYGDPQQVTAEVQALLLDGERVLATRAGNRTIELPLVVKGSNRQDLSARMDALLAAIHDTGYLLTWTPDGGLAMQWECFGATWEVSWNVRLEDKLFVQQVKVTIPALPYGRNPALSSATLALQLAAAGGHLYTLADILGSARAPADVQMQFSAGVDSWLLHKPPIDADSNAPILKAVAGGSATFSGAEKLKGTYVVVAGVSTYSAPNQPRTMRCTIYDPSVGDQIVLTRSYVSSLNLRPLVLGNISLPMVARPPGALSSLSFTFADSGGGLTGDTDVSSLMLLDTRGQVVASFDRQTDESLTQSAWVDAGSILEAVGPVWNSPDTFKINGYVAKDLRLSGGPLSVFRGDNGNRLLVYSAGATPTVTVQYRPHWLHERLV